MEETGEREGLPRATFNYHLFCRSVGRKGLSRATFATIYNGENMGSKGTSWTPWTDLCYTNLIEMGKGKGLP